MKSFKILIAFLLISMTFYGCVYYNTFYYAKKNFKAAEKERNKAKSDGAPGSSASNYRAAVDKASKVLTDHPDSKYVDDALYIIGKSYFHLGDYVKSERKFRELLAAYPKSEYMESSLFYLGLCRLRQEEYILARQTLLQVDSLTRDKTRKGEVEYMLGEIELNQNHYEEALNYFGNYLAKYGNADRAAEVQFQMGEINTHLKNYDSSKNAYLAVAKYNPDDSLYFRAEFRAGQAYYELGQIDSGLAIFEALAKNDKFYKSAGEIRLQLAKALTMKGDFEAALTEYGKITTEFAKTEAAAIAYFEMGEIQMREFGKLDLAKSMYDSSKTIGRNSSVFQTAVERSADISKLSEYRQQISSEDLNQSAQSQYQLAELYLFQLENPDTALAEFQLLIDSFPQSVYAAKAYMAKAYIFKNHLNLPDSAQAAYRKVMENYAHTDYVEDAAHALQINLDSLGIDYPGKAYKRAERILLEKSDIDSAMILFQTVIDDYPDSKYAAKAAYAKAWLMEIYLPPEKYNPGDSSFVPDSTLIYAYQNVADAFDGTIYADSAMAKLGKKKTPKPVKPVQKEVLEENKDSVKTVQDTAVQTPVDTTIYWSGTPAYIDSLIDTLHVINDKPSKEGQFIYPPAAYYSKIEGYVGFMVKMDAFGKPTIWRILQSSGNKDIDDAAIEALKYTIFDVAKVDVLYVNQWLFYRIMVQLPDEVKGFK